MPHDPRTEQRVGAIVREELVLFWEDLGQRFQKLGAGFRSALENYDSALQPHDRKHQELQQFLLRLALGRWWVATMKSLIARLTGMLSGMSAARIWAMKTGSRTVLLLLCVIDSVSVGERLPGRSSSNGSGGRPDGRSKRAAATAPASADSSGGHTEPSGCPTIWPTSCPRYASNVGNAGAAAGARPPMKLFA